MKSVQSDPYSTHQEVQLLLPWYVNHSLQGAELRQVEEHLNVCLMCKRESIILQKFAKRVNQALPLHMSEQAAFTELKNRLHQTSQTRQPQTEPTLANFTRPKTTKTLALPPRALLRPAWALAAVFVLTLIVPSYFKLNQMLSNDYRTLSEASLVNPNRYDLHLVFADNTTSMQIQTILTPLAGRIIGIQTEQAVHTVRFEQIESKEDFINRLAQLKKNPHIIFAEPAFSLLTPTNTESVHK